MNLIKMIEELRQERRSLDEVLMALENLAAGRGRRRGRPPAWMTALRRERGKRRGKRLGRPPGSRNRNQARNTAVVA